MASVFPGMQAADGAAIVLPAGQRIDDIVLDGRSLKHVPLADQVIVFRDPFNFDWHVAHQGTQEVRRLPATTGAWLFGELPNGDGFVCDSHSDNEFMVSDLLYETMLETEDGELAISSTADDTKSDEPTWRRVLAASFRYLELILPLTDIRAECTLQCAAFSRPRDGARIFWSLPAVYKTCNLHFPAAGVWIHKSWFSWQTLAYEIARPYQLLRSRLSTLTDGSECKPLDWPSVGSHVFLLLLMRWSLLPRQRGGMVAIRDKKAVRELLAAIVGGLPLEDWKLVLFTGGRKALMPTYPKPREFLRRSGCG